MLALKLARAVDAVPDDQLTEIMRAMTQLRLVLADISRSIPAAVMDPEPDDAIEVSVGGVDSGDEFSQLIGSVRPEVVNPPTV